MKSLAALAFLAVVGGCSPPSDDTVNTVLEDYGGADDIQVNRTDLMCKPQFGAACSKSGCQSLKPPTIWFEWQAATETYRRCDAKGCDSYAAATAASGVFTNIGIIDHGLMLRIAQDGSFMELATQGKVAYVYHGSCSTMEKR